MRSAPVTPARIGWDADGTPLSLDSGDVYHARIGAAAQARHVFLAGNGLPERWQQRDDFTIAETGFGLGHNFVATWRAWRDDPQRCRRLHYVAIEGRPPTRADLERAHAGADGAARALIDAWPPLVGGVHTIAFDGGALRLLLAFGDVRDLLPRLCFGADAFYLDGFAPALNPEMWEPRVIKALARRAAPGATAATWCVARGLRDALDGSGFQWQRVPGIGGKREVLRARFEPRHALPPLPASFSPRRAIVVGAGLAGAACASALAAQGVEVEVIERDPAPASRSSGNPAGLFHATVHRDDGPYARLFRAAALHTAHVLATLGPARVPHDARGLLRLEQRLDGPAMQHLLDAQHLPAELVQALDADAASARAGVPLASPAWFYPQGGWASPAALVRAWLAQPGIRLRSGCEVHALRAGGDGWQLLDAAGQVLATTPQLVLANAERIHRLLLPLGWPPFALQRSRGQVSLFDGTAHRLALPLAGDGYALPLPDGGLLCGATTQADDDDAELRDADHRANFERLQRLCGVQAPADEAAWRGRVGWRVQTPDRLPLAGPMPLRSIAAGTRLDQAHLVPREGGLHVLSALGSRGLTLAPLLGELVAARITGAPLPLERQLVDLVDPARWLVRAARQNTSRRTP